MTLKNSSTRWGVVSMLLHWTVVLLIIAQFVMANIAGDLPLGMQKLAWLARHKSVGITILGIAIIRLAWRLLSPGPALPSKLGPLERVLAATTHIGLYLVLFLMPLSGWLMSSAKGYPVSWFNLLQLPDLVAKNEDTFKILEACHGILALALVVLALLHVAGALKHHFVYRDDVLKRMLPCLALGLTVAFFAGSMPARAVDLVSAPGQGTLTFTFTQAGATGSGVFRKFDVHFRAPDAAGVGGELIVAIEVASLDTDDGERDEILRGPDLFATERFPAARFEAQRIEADGDGRYRAVGTLTIRDVSKALELPLELRPARDAAGSAGLLVGEVAIDRLDYGVGQGEWKSTEWVANKVTISWSVSLVSGDPATAGLARPAGQT
ncbi:MAG: cytochrome b/b6 domain-containing protein [Halioglobus sp.]|nr:cytochrome b/b6 domain-containing protein [Halioglobus sp.]